MPNTAIKQQHQAGAWTPVSLRQPACRRAPRSVTLPGHDGHGRMTFQRQNAAHLSQAVFENFAPPGRPRGASARWPTSEGDEGTNSVYSSTAHSVSGIIVKHCTPAPRGPQGSGRTEHTRCDTMYRRSDGACAQRLLGNGHMTFMAQDDATDAKSRCRKYCSRSSGDSIENDESANRGYASDDSALYDPDED